jgi:acetyltransferase-like isoleucine patch superfamily enzyme
MFRKLDQVLTFALVKIMVFLKLKARHRILLKGYRRWGMQMKEWPNYLSALSDVDGTDYSNIYLGEGVTISSYVRLLTHDWSPHTVLKAFGIQTDKPAGRFGSIYIDDFSFVGTGSILMPGCHIGRGCIIGSGTVVRGKIPDYSIVIGSPCQIVGDSREYIRKLASRESWGLTEAQLNKIL